MLGAYTAIRPGETPSGRSPRLVSSSVGVSGISLTYEPRGPYGAKEIGEGSTLPVLGAVAHAIANATGVWIKDLPITPEKILRALKEKRAAKESVMVQHARARTRFTSRRWRGRILTRDGDRPTLDHERIADFCRRHRIRRLALFGSILREDFDPESDADVLVEFEPGARTGLAFFGMQDELSKVLGRTVDLNTPDCLSKYFRDTVLRNAQVLYDAA